MFALVDYKLELLGIWVASVGTRQRLVFHKTTAVGVRDGGRIAKCPDGIGHPQCPALRAQGEGPPVQN